MSTKIRLARFGRNKTPFYYIVVTDSRNRRDSKFIERIGNFNPLLADDNKEKIILNKDRAEYWLSVGAEPSERAAILMIKLGVKGAEKYKPVFTKAKAPKKIKKVEEPKAEEKAVAEEVKTEESKA
ncbi:MAG TPA: 30S ribosomal protein S16 [Rickettsiales bacterium]|nr:30S ribosomal protein S16 [Rickettsiales bacterium]